MIEQYKQHHKTEETLDISLLVLEKLLDSNIKIIKNIEL